MLCVYVMGPLWVIESRRMRWVGHVARMGEDRGAYRVLVEKPEGKSPLGRPRRRCVNTIRVDLQEVWCGYMDSIGLVQDRDRWRTLVSAVMNLRVPWNAGNFLTSCKPVSFSRRTLHHGISKWVRCSELIPIMTELQIVFKRLVLSLGVQKVTYSNLGRETICTDFVVFVTRLCRTNPG